MARAGSWFLGAVAAGQRCRPTPLGSSTQRQAEQRCRPRRATPASEKSTPFLPWLWRMWLSTSMVTVPQSGHGVLRSRHRSCCEARGVTGGGRGTSSTSWSHEIGVCGELWGVSAPSGRLCREGVLIPLGDIENLKDSCGEDPALDAASAARSEEELPADPFFCTPGLPEAERWGREPARAGDCARRVP